MLRLLKSLFGIGTTTAASGGIVGKVIDIVSEKTEDVDKRNAMIRDLVMIQVQADTQPAWLQALGNWQNLGAGARAALVAMMATDAVHKLARVLLWGWVVWLYVDMSKTLGQPVDVETLMTLAAGPALYTILKGRGR